MGTNQWNGHYTRSPRFDQQRLTMSAVVPNDGIGAYHRASANWKKRYPEAEGNFQSPINIQPNTAVFDSQLSILDCHYPSIKDLLIINNGKCVSLKPIYGKLDQTSLDCRPVIMGGPLLSGCQYELKEIVFHWGKEDGRGSEHTIFYKSYPMEIQMIHLNTKYNQLQEGYRHADGITISSILVQRAAENETLQPVIERLAYIPYKNQLIMLGHAFNIQALLPDKELRDYWTYEGSVTHPPCCEGVTWIVYRYPLSVSFKQLEEFRRLRNHARDTAPARGDDGFLVDNFRCTQRLNDRCIRASFHS